MKKTYSPVEYFAEKPELKLFLKSQSRGRQAKQNCSAAARRRPATRLQLACVRAVGVSRRCMHAARRDPGGQPSVRTYTRPYTGAVNWLGIRPRVPLRAIRDDDQAKQPGQPKSIESNSYRSPYLVCPLVDRRVV